MHPDAVPPASGRRTLAGDRREGWKAVPSVRDFLERLRPSGTPGTAALSAVPADRVAELSAELEAVLAQVADAQAEAAQIRRAAAVEAERRRDAGLARARSVVDEARRSAEAERRQAAASAQSQAAADIRHSVEAAHRQAAAVAALARSREPGLVARVVTLARAEVDTILDGPP